jgi:hypothetical protein
MHTGSARITVDDEPPVVVRPESVALLLPGHRESFEFDAREETHHSWAQLGVAGEAPEAMMDAPRVLPASAELTELVRETASAARAPAAIWRYVVDAGASVDGPADPVDLARRHLDVRRGDPELSLERAPPRRT